MAIDWRAGYSASWRLFKVDRETWADARLVPGVTSVSVERSIDEDAPTIEGGTLEVDVSSGETFEEGYYRVVMVAEQGGSRERVDVCTLLCSATSGDIARGNDAITVSGGSVLVPASKRMLDAGSYAPAGVDGVRFAADMLAQSINAPVESQGGFTLDEAYVFDNGTSALEAVWKVLRAGGYTIQIQGDGTVRVTPLPDVPDLPLDAAGARLLHDGIHHELDYSEVPNRYIAADAGVEAVASNDDPGSPTSFVTRGWHSDIRDDSPTRVNGETLQAYAERRLEEESTVWDVRSYEREWWPGVFPDSLVRGSLASVLLDGDLRITRQSLACGRGIVVTEEARKEVKTWRRQ